MFRSRFAPCLASQRQPLASDSSPAALLVELLLLLTGDHCLSDLHFSREPVPTGSPWCPCQQAYQHIALAGLRPYDVTVRFLAQVLVAGCKICYR